MIPGSDGDQYRRPQSVDKRRKRQRKSKGTNPSGSPRIQSTTEEKPPPGSPPRRTAFSRTRSTSVANNAPDIPQELMEPRSRPRRAAHRRHRERPQRDTSGPAAVGYTYCATQWSRDASEVRTLRNSEASPRAEDRRQDVLALELHPGVMGCTSTRRRRCESSRTCGVKCTGRATDGETA